MRLLKTVAIGGIGLVMIATMPAFAESQSKIAPTVAT